MFKLKSHIPFDSCWTFDRKRDWVGNEVADLAAKCALQAWRAHAEFADQYCGCVKFASELGRSRFVCRIFLREPAMCGIRGR